MRACILIAAVCVLMPSAALAQLTWERTYGGTGQDRGFSVQQTTDAGYIVAGCAGMYGENEQVYLIKVDSCGDTLWTRTYGRTGVWERGYCVEQTADRGYIVAGYTSSLQGAQIWVIKTDSLGDSLWDRNYGNRLSRLTGCGRSIQQTPDGGYIVAGYYDTDSDSIQVYLVKTDSLGDTLWTRTYGGTGNDYGYSLDQTGDGGYIIAGSTDSYGAGQQDVFLVKTNAAGDTLWTRTYGGTYTDIGYCVKQTLDQGYIVAGYTASFGNSGQAYLIRTDSSGDTLWTRTCGGQYDDYGYSALQTADSGYVVAGRYWEWRVGYLVFVLKFSALGEASWLQTFGARGEGLSIGQCRDGGYIVTGYDGAQVFLAKTDPGGLVAVAEPSRSGLRTPCPGPTIVRGLLQLPPELLTAHRYLLSISGRKVLDLHPGPNDVSRLSPGVYFVSERSAAAVRKAVIQR
jgi:hypothetical protein